MQFLFQELANRNSSISINQLILKDLSPREYRLALGRFLNGKSMATVSPFSGQQVPYESESYFPAGRRICRARSKFRAHHLLVTRTQKNERSGRTRLRRVLQCVHRNRSFSTK